MMGTMNALTDDIHDHSYTCTNVRCGERDARQLMAFSPSEMRMICGFVASCDSCGRPLRYDGPASDAA